MPNVRKMENAGLNVGSISIPVILVTVDNMDFATWGQFYQFTAELMEHLGGSICCFTTYVNLYTNPELANTLLDSIPRTLETYGSSEGFSFSRKTGTYENHVNVVGMSNTSIGGIYYKGNLVWYNNPFAGTAPANFPIKMSPVILFIDEDDKIFYGWNYPADIISYWSGGWGGLGVQDDCLPYTEIPREILQWYKSHGDSETFPTLSTGDVITDDIGNRVRVGVKDPYSGGGNSTTGGGNGTWNTTSDPIDFPSLPSLSAVDTGFITLFHPTTAQLDGLANFIWNDLDLDNFHKVFNDPMEAILGLSIVPVAVPDAGMRQVIIGNMMAVNITMPAASTQWVEVDCGSIFVDNYTGGYLDYNPTTKYDIYLPFIGIRPLNPDDVVGKTIHLKYHIDILSGACTAMLKCGDSVLYSHTGNCALSVPVAGKDWTNVINGAVQIAAAVGLAVASDGASIPLTAGAAGSAMSGTVATMKTQIAKSSNMSGANGFLGSRSPYLIKTLPNICLPPSQDEDMGYPSFITTKLENLSGYTEVESIHLENITATDTEKQEIMELLQKGVIL